LRHHNIGFGCGNGLRGLGNGLWSVGLLCGPAHRAAHHGLSAHFGRV
jgi:hypothetical protein